MSYDSAERSIHGGSPWEAYWFCCGPNNYRYTSGDVARTVLGQVYEPAAIRSSEPEQNQELTSGSITVELPLDNPVAQLFVGYLPPHPVSLIIYRGHDGETEFVSSYTGTVSHPKFTETCELTVVSKYDALKQGLPSLRWQIQCPRQIYSSDCGLSKNSYIVPATISGVNGSVLTSSRFADFADGYFAPGWIEACGTSMAVKAHVGSTVTLYYPLAGLQEGDTIAIYPACKGTEEDCRDRFNNVVNCLACARIPSENPYGEGGIA